MNWRTMSSTRQTILTFQSAYRGMSFFPMIDAYKSWMWELIVDAAVIVFWENLWSAAEISLIGNIFCLRGILFEQNSMEQYINWWETDNLYTAPRQNFATRCWSLILHSSTMFSRLKGNRRNAGEDMSCFIVRRLQHFVEKPVQRWECPLDTSNPGVQALMTSGVSVA